MSSLWPKLPRNAHCSRNSYYYDDLIWIHMSFLSNIAYHCISSISASLHFSPVPSIFPEFIDVIFVGKFGIFRFGKDEDKE